MRLRSFAALPLADERAATCLIAPHSNVVRIVQIHLCVTLCDVEVDREDEIDYDKSLDKRDAESNIQTVDVFFWDMRHLRTVQCDMRRDMKIGMKTGHVKEEDKRGNHRPRWDRRVIRLLGDWSQNVNERMPCANGRTFMMRASGRS